MKWKHRWWLWWGFARLRGFWESVRPFIQRLRFFLKWRLASAQELYSFGQDQSTMAQRAETTVAE